MGRAFRAYYIVGFTWMLAMTIAYGGLVLAGNGPLPLLLLAYFLCADLLTLSMPKLMPSAWRRWWGDEVLVPSGVDAEEDAPVPS